MPISSSVFPAISCSCFKVSGLVLRSLIHFELILVQVRDRDLVSILYMWISSFSSNICWRGCLISIICFGLLCRRSVSYSWVGLCLDLLFSSIGLYVCFCGNTMLFLLLWLWSIVWSWILWYLQHWTFCSELLWLLEVFSVPIYIYYYYIIILFLLFICAYKVWVISPLFPLLPPSPPLPPHYQAETILPLSLILLKREYKQ
jgi:hypothetical protein